MKNYIKVSVCGAAMLWIAACNRPAEHTTAGNDRAAEMKARFHKLNDSFNTGKAEAFDTLIAADAEYHSADSSMPRPKGPAGLKQMIAEIRTGTPDLKSDIKYIAVDGDKLIAYGTMGGTNTEPMMGMPPTNKKWSADFADVVQFDDNMQMTDHWGVLDAMKIMKDLGLMPPPGQAPAAMPKPAEPTAP